MMETNSRVAFEVRGMPATQGSKRAIMPRYGKRPVLIESSGDRLKLWRHAISDEARRAMGDTPLIEGPVTVVAHFRVPRPTSAPKKRRTWPIGARSGDLDKLQRALLDACTGVVWHDDAQVVHIVASKDYGAPGALVEVLAVIA